MGKTPAVAIFFLHMAPPVVQNTWIVVAIFRPAVLIFLSRDVGQEAVDDINH